MLSVVIIKRCFDVCQYRKAVVRIVGVKDTSVYSYSSVQFESCAYSFAKRALCDGLCLQFSRNCVTTFQTDCKALIVLLV